MKTLHDAKKSLCLIAFMVLMILLEILCFLQLVFVSSRYFLWLGRTKLAAPALARVLKVLQIHHESIVLLMLLRKLDTIVPQLIWESIENAGIFLYIFGRFIMLLSMGCLTAICKTCCYQLRYYRLRELLKLAMLGLFLILVFCEVLPLIDVLDKSVRQQVSNLGSYLLGPNVTNRRTRQLVFVGNPAFGGRGQGVRRTLRGGNKTFDTTLGYPGEGWAQLSMATWNTRSLTYERFQYCTKLGYDVLAITELWRNQQKFQSKNTRFTASSPILITRGPNKGKMRFPDDRAAGVGILLSPRAQRKLMSFGSEGERVCWTRLKGPVCNLFIIAVYLPHRGRIQPCQDDTLRDLEKVLTRVPKRDCICIMGDLNEQLEGGVNGRTGKWVAGPKSPKADKIMQILQLHELTAVNTTFEPRRTSALHTFIQTKRKEDSESDYGEHVGKSVRTRYKNEWYQGDVVSTYGQNGKQKWIVKYTDNYVRHYGRKQLENILTRIKKEKIGKQIDYVIVSSRWKSCVVNCRTRWQPAIHRDIHGERNDHALVHCIWKWRLRVTKSKPCKDLNYLFSQKKDEHGNPVSKARMATFETAVEDKLEQLNFSASNDNATDMHSKICTAINHAIETTVPSRVVKQGAKREVSEATQKLFKDREKLRGQGSPEQYDEIQSKIKKSSLADFTNWVEKWAANIESAAGKGDTKKVYDGVKVLACKREKPSPNLTTDSQGNSLKCAKETAQAWNTFLTSKFAATDEELTRPELEPLPCTQGIDDLTDEQFARGLAKMSNNRACGHDGIPSEIYKRSDRCKELLKLLLQKIWHDEDVPVDFARATFVMLFKDKGSANDPTKYRCIGLLTHAYKVMAQCLLEKLESETESFLSDWQAGFRKNRGCRDNVLTLRTIYEDMLEKGEALYVTFIDYSAAFDSVSHKFLDRALKEAGASDKSRALFRAIYNRASAVTKVASTDGAEVLSDPFPIRRGVVQGDITSPLYFILALELILRTHDADRNKGVMFGGERIGTLGYADDAALLDTHLETAAARVTAISRGSKKDADMMINKTKTEVMHVKEQGRVSPLTKQEAKSVCKHECPHDDCRRVFYNAHGCKVHAGKCKKRDVFPVDKILEVKGATGSPTRRFLISWKGYGAEHNTWEPRRNISPGVVNAFLHANNLYEHDWPGARCPQCDMPCKSERGVKIHLRSCLQRPDSEQNFTGTCAAAKVKVNKLIAAQDDEETVLCEEKGLKNVFLFKYLGSVFAADGNQQHDIKRRVAMAMARMGQLRHVFNATIPLCLKMKIYKSAVCSLLTYGCEAWDLNEKNMALLNGANARCLSRFTGKDAHAEASAKTRSYDLVLAIRKRRFKWLGHILRMPESRLIKLATKVQFQQGLQGNLFMDIPCNPSYEGICGLAKNRKIWRQMSCRLNNPATMHRYVKAYLAMPTSPHLSPRSRRRARRNSSAATVTTPTPTPSTTSPHHGPRPVPPAISAARYRARDVHEAFFRPKSKQPTKHKRKTKAESKPPLTDKQRAAWAHAHYVIHHGSPMDADHFLQTKRATTISPNTRNQLKQMCNVGATNPTPTTARPPVILTSATPTISRHHQRPPTADTIGSPQPTPPTILGHHYPTTHNTRNNLTLTPQQHTHTHHYNTHTPLSPITHTHLNVLHHSMHDPHHITTMNDTYIYVNHPSHKHNNRVYEKSWVW